MWILREQKRNGVAIIRRREVCFYQDVCIATITTLASKLSRVACSNVTSLLTWISLTQYGANMWSTCRFLVILDITLATLLFKFWGGHSIVMCPNSFLLQSVSVFIGRWIVIWSKQCRLPAAHFKHMQMSISHHFSFKTPRAVLQEVNAAMHFPNFIGNNFFITDACLKGKSFHVSWSPFSFVVAWD